MLIAILSFNLNNNKKSVGQPSITDLHKEMCSQVFYYKLKVLWHDVGCPLDCYDGKIFKDFKESTINWFYNLQNKHRYYVLLLIKKRGSHTVYKQ